ncbi:MAG: RimK family alpha-L-glutamate ligase [Gammaproteobacteria bacterium]|nr:RimK family alpha-L-glutamate ligase [Gammaproteobacteria bacterium]
MTAVAIFTDDPGWHGAHLRAAFAGHGCESRFVTLNDCSIVLRTGMPEVRIPGFRGAPAAAFVRGVAGGTLEEVVFRLNVLHALKAAGTRVYNDGRAIERSVDKGLTSFLLAGAGIPTPHTRVTADPATATAFVEDELRAGHTVVSKPLFGSQGKGVVRIGRVADLPDAEAANGVWYLQRFVASAGPEPEDWRLFIIGGRTVAAMRRSSGSWPTNVACGAQCHAAVPAVEAAELAERATRVLDMDYAGVDLLRDRRGAWWLIEVNSIPAWRGLEEATGIDVAGLLAADLLDRIRQQQRPLEVV